MNILLPLLWISSQLMLLVTAAFVSRIRFSFRIRWDMTTIWILFLILLPILVRTLNYQPDRIHGDDLLTASFSLDYHPRTANFFAGIPEGNVWVAKFPTPYFLFQKLFLQITGSSILTVKLSILPYILIVSWMTYRIASLVLGRLGAIVAVTLYAFMPISVYLETLGLHFVSSTAAFTVFTYLLFRAHREPKPFWFAGAGIAAAWCYFFYTSSYIAFPLLCIALLFQTIRRRSLTGIVWALIGFLLTIAPFVHAAWGNVYFSERINQVSLLTGSWSDKKEHIQSIGDAWKIVTDNTILSLRSLAISGIGGHGGYTFDQQAMFHIPGLILFVLGFAMSIFLLWKSREIAFMVIVIILSFLTGIALTIPPPAFHRFSLAFPFIAIIASVPFRYLDALLPRRITVIMTAIIIAMYAGSGIRYFQKAAAKEARIDDAAIIRYVNETYPQRAIHIAAFPTFALGRLYPFFIPSSAASVDCQYHNAYLSNFNTEEHYVYIVTLPQEFISLFQKADPKGMVIPFSDKYSLFVNE